MSRVQGERIITAVGIDSESVNTTGSSWDANGLALRDRTQL